MKAKLYITDEGFGPLVRQSAILEEFAALGANIDFTLQTHQHLQAAKRILPTINFQDKYNNITWDKKSSGSPDTEIIAKKFKNYLPVSEDYIKSELSEFDYNFVISDFVYEAFKVAKQKNVPAFGIAHFTWDWFFCKMYPPPLSSAVIKRFFEYAELASVLYFPPFTPKEILTHYKKKVKEVPLIVRKKAIDFQDSKTDKFKILIMDSGSGLLKPHIKKSLSTISSIMDVEFYVASTFNTIESENIKKIEANKLFVDYIPYMDLVIGRAGFNTISECIAYRTPMLLISEAENPEMQENIINIKYQGLGSFLSLEEFRENLSSFLPKFIEHEYQMIKYSMENHEIRTDGARVVAEDIINRIA